MGKFVREDVADVTPIFTPLIFKRQHTTTSRVPLAGRVSTIDSGGLRAVNVREGKRLSKTTISYRPAGSSVGNYKSSIVIFRPSDLHRNWEYIFLCHNAANTFVSIAIAFFPYVYLK